MVTTFTLVTRALANSSIKIKVDILIHTTKHDYLITFFTNKRTFCVVINALHLK